MKQKTKDWHDVEDDRKKYAAYLCSREWNVKKEAVHERAKGKCERCGIFPINAVHHLTYERKYREELTDLQGTCKPCHEFTHGKSNCDPLRITTNRHLRRFISFLERVRGSGGKSPPPWQWVAGFRGLLPHLEEWIKAIEVLDAAGIAGPMNALREALPFAIPNPHLIIPLSVYEEEIDMIYRAMGFDPDDGEKFLASDEDEDEDEDE